MEGLLLGKGLYPQKLLEQTAEYILSVQKPSGEIPWFTGGITDPWDHTEAAMGLSIAGKYDAAEQAYQWLADEQLEDGSWWANYKDGKPVAEGKRETNFIAYIATGVWHHYMITQDKAFVERIFPTVKRAMDFIVSMQAETGEIYWAVDAEGNILEDALVTACSSVYKSLECAVLLANVIGDAALAGRWNACYEKLGYTLKHRPERFDRTWESKARYSMDWFYPILAGVYSDSEARARLRSRWDKFVEADMGCRCVSDEPWVTVAESCELTMALLAAGEHGKAVKLYSWLHQWRDENDGAYWTGWQFVENIVWPEEKTTWTSGAIMLAADALTEHTPASRLFLESQMTNALLEEHEEEIEAEEA